MPLTVYTLFLLLYLPPPRSTRSDTLSPDTTIFRSELKGASSTFYLLRKEAGSRPVESRADERQYTRHWTPVHIDFVVDDLDKAAERAINAGALQEGECIQWRGSKCISFSDPLDRKSTRLNSSH